MKSFTVNLTKEDTLIIKGIAIIAIVLHNYFHLFKGVVGENEFWYIPGRVNELWLSLHDSFLEFLINFISMYGHYGVVAFFFVSGYGLAKKYKDRELEHDFILKNAIKLWKLFVPILICFVGLAIIKAFITEDFSSASEHIGMVLCKALSRILFISNFSEYTTFWISGSWWFFSAIFQMYVLYKYIFSKTSSVACLFIWALLMILIQFFLYYHIDIKFLRINAPAWIPVFIYGMLFAKYEMNIPLYILLFSFFACFFVDTCFYTWVWGYSFLFFAFLFLLYVLRRTPLKNMMIKIGELSAYLFVINTFVRTFFYTFICNPIELHDMRFIFFIGIIHFVVCLVIAYIYKIISMKLFGMMKIR